MFEASITKTGYHNDSTILTKKNTIERKNTNLISCVLDFLYICNMKQKKSHIEVLLIILTVAVIILCILNFNKNPNQITYNFMFTGGVDPQITPVPSRSVTTTTLDLEKSRKIKNLLVSDLLEEALNSMKDSVKEDNPEILLLLSQFNAIRNQLREGTLTQEDFNVNNTRIKKATLDLSERLFGRP